MKRLSTITVLFVLFVPFMLVAAGCGSVTGYAVVVNGTTITRTTLDNELKDVASNKKFVQLFDQNQPQGGPGPILGTAPGTFGAGYVADLLTQLIDFTLIHQYLSARHALPDAAAIQRARQEVVQRYLVPASQAQPSVQLLTAFPARYQDTIVRRQAEVDAMQASLSKADLSDQALKAYYDTHQARFVAELCIRHILVADPAKAAQLKTQIDGGADFAALAKANSTDQSSAVNGGALTGSAPDGCMTTTDLQSLVSQFSQAAATLPVNQVSAPVKTQFGYHLIEVTARKIAPYDQRVAQAARQALLQPSQQAFTAELAKLVQAATVKVDPRFGLYDKKAANGPAVIPPKAPAVSSGGGQPATTVAPAPGG